MELSTHSPFLKLPPELLVCVIQHCLSEVPSFRGTIDNRDIIRAYYKRLRDISLVCRRWAMVVRGSSSLWGVISTHMPSGFLQLCLARSGGHAIDLDCSSFDGTSQYLPFRRSREIRPFWNAVRPHFSRCRTAYIRCHQQDWEWFIEHLERPAPRLRSLALNAELGSGLPPTIKLFGGRSSDLKSLELYRVPLDWSATMLQGLTSLTLESIWDAPSPAAIVNIIKNCQEMEFLSFKSMNENLMLADTDGRWSPIDFPHLRTLIITENSLTQTEALLRSIKSIPRCTQFSVSLNFWGGQYSVSVHDLLHHLIPDMQRVLKIDERDNVSGPHICLNFLDEDSVSMCSPRWNNPSAFELLIHGSSTAGIDGVNFISSLSEGTNTRVSLLVDTDGITIHPGGAVPVPDTELLQAVQNLPVSHLLLRDLGEWSGWLTYLSSFYQDGTRSFSHPFREMTHLTCDEDQSTELSSYENELLAMVIGRYSPPNSDTAAQDLLARGLEYKPPAFLTKLVYDGRLRMPTIAPDQFNSILGDGVFEVLTKKASPGGDTVR